MSLYRRNEFWHYDFTAAGRRYRGATGQKSKARARRVESQLMAEVEKRGGSAILRRAPLLSDFGPRFLSWVDESRGLSPNTRRY
jgi:hypothetical protein